MGTRTKISGMKTFLAVIFSVMLTFTMMPVMPFMTNDAHAASLTNSSTNTFDINDGSITIENDGSNIKVVQNSNTLKDGIAVTDPITITGSTTANTVNVDATNNATIVLKDLTIDVSSVKTNCAFKIAGGTNLSNRTVTVKLAGTNKLASGARMAGLQKNGTKDISGSLIIEDDKNTNGAGELTATSGIYSNDTWTAQGYGAGIGGEGPSNSVGEACDAITITGGHIETSSYYGAGIGGGYGTSAGSNGDITISGGWVDASSVNGAGIGGGFGYPTSVSAGTLSSGTNGNAWISMYGNYNYDQVSLASDFSGLCFVNNGGTIYGTSFTLPSDAGDLIIPKKGASLTIGAAQSLTIPSGVKIKSPENIGFDIYNSGKIINKGSIEKALNFHNYGSLTNEGTITVSNQFNTINTSPYYGAVDNKGVLNCTGKLSPGGPLFTSTGTITMPLRWSDGTNYATIKSDGGTLNIKELYYSGGYVSYEKPTKDGYTFDGWSDGTTAYKATDKIPWVSGIVLTAQWGGGSASTGDTSATTTDTTTNEDGTVQSTTTTVPEVTSSGSGEAAVSVNSTEGKTIVENVKAAEAAAKADGKTIETNVVISDAGVVDADKVSVSIPAATISALASETNATVTFKTANGDVTIDQKALDTIAAKSGDEGYVTLVVEKVAHSTLSEAVMETLGDNAKVLDLKLVTDKGNVSNFNGGVATVVTSLPDGMSPDDATCVFLDDNNVAHSIKGAPVTVNGKTMYKFVTGHYSHYAIVSKDSASKLVKKLTAPKSVKAAAASTHSVKVTWKAATSASSYKVYKATRKSGKYRYVGKTTKTSYIVKGLKKNTNYYFKVRAVNIDGYKTSKIVTAKTKALSGSVSFSLKNVGGTNVKVHWKAVSGAEGYQVANNAGGKMKAKWTGTNSQNTYTSVNMKKGKTYKFKMRYCKTVSGKKVWSSWTSVKTIKVK